MPKNEYFEGFLNKLKTVLSPDTFKKIHEYARSYSGGKNKGIKSKDVHYEKDDKLTPEFSALMDVFGMEIVEKDKDENENEIKIDLLGKEDKEDDKKDSSKILKAENKKQVLYSVVLPVNFRDAHDDVISEEEAEEAAHDYLMKSRAIFFRHKEKINAAVVESWIEKTGFSMGGQKINKGDWVAGIKIFDSKVWEMVESGKLNAVSIGGLGKREKI